MHSIWEPIRQWVVPQRVLRVGGLIVGLLILGSAENAYAWWDLDWQFRRKITFDNSAQAENLTNVPVLIILTSSRINYAETQNAGQDIRFVDADGTALAHEIETWNESGTSYVWVSVPQIDASSSTDYIWMYYGNAGVADGQNADGTWDSSFVGVYHLNETSGAVGDSAGTFDGTVVTPMTRGVTGKIGNAYDFTGGRVNIDAYASNAPTGAGTGTIEAWVDRDFSDATADTTDYDFLRLQVDNDNKIILAWVDVSTDRWRVQVTAGASGTTASAVLSTIPQNTWKYFVATWDVANKKPIMYVDGALVVQAGSVYGTWAGTPAEWSLGAAFDGQLDEHRVSNATRSAAWIAAQFKSMADTYNTYGSEERRPPFSSGSPQYPAIY